MSTEEHEERIDVGAALQEVFYSATEEDRRGNAANLVDALYENGRMIAHALRLLGNADAATPMGALEAHGQAVKDAGHEIAVNLAAIAEALDNLADAIREARAEE